MQIVSQSAFLSHSLFPSTPLLAAPPPPKLLAAPRIAGLLPARVSSQPEIIVEFPPTREELLRQLGPIRSREAMNAELIELAFGPLDVLTTRRDLRAHSARPAITERPL